MDEKKHKFLMQPGKWLGEGKVTFSASTEEISFFTKWNIQKDDEQRLQAVQDVEMKGTGENVHNIFTLYDLKKEGFHIQLENDLVGKVTGTGLIEPGKVAWEFRSHINFQGYEVYQRQENGEYHFHAEYATPDQFRTIINGRIWEA